MKKRSAIIATMVATVVSLAVVILSYFGITRLLMLHVASPKGFTKKYAALPKATDGRVVVSFATSADKIGKIKPMINSILDQTVKVDQIILVVPRGRPYDIPDYVRGAVTILPSGKDYGEGTKLIPVLLREPESDTTIIALKDGVVYGKDFIYSLVERSQQDPDALLVDQKGVAMLVKPGHFDPGVVDRGRDNFDDQWFLGKAKSSGVVNYTENYRIIGF